MSQHNDQTTKTPPIVSKDYQELDNDTTNDLISPPDAQHGKAISTQIAVLAIAGHAVHKLTDGGYLVCKYGHTFHAVDFADLQAFARRLEVN